MAKIGNQSELSVYLTASTTPERDSGHAIIGTGGKLNDRERFR